MGFIRHTWTLVRKNWTIMLRHPFTSVFVPFVLPIVLAVWFGIAQNLFRPPVTYGSGSPHPIRTLAEALGESGPRNRVVFVNSGFDDGPIDRAIDSLVTQASEADGTDILRRSQQSSLNTECEPGLRAVTTCFGAVVFHSSPSEGNSGLWNYTIFHDGAVSGFNIHVNSNNNHMDRYLLPLQRAVDTAIADVASSNSSSSAVPGPQPAELPGTADRYPFTSQTPEELARDIREAYQSSIINFLGVAYLTTVIFITYHMTGFIATEREAGMIQLIDAMMLVKHRWLAQAARIASYHISFAVLYLPGWVIGSMILRFNIFSNTNVGVILVFQILTGLAMASSAILFSSFFPKAQLSGVTALLVSILCGILSQALTNPGTGPVIVLSLLFAPSNFVFFLGNVARYERERLPTNMVQAAPRSPYQVTGVVFWVFLVIQIFLYPAIGALVESYLFGTTAKGRTILSNPPGDASASDDAVCLDSFTKHYPPSKLSQLLTRGANAKHTVRAVDGLTLKARRGQILALLGANGSGKSTTLDCIAGTTRMTSGSITIDGTGGLGIAPQKNVLWDDLTVEEHIRIFNRLKAPGQTASKAEIRDLVRSIDLELKRRAKSKTLSGGQKRKLQLGMMLTGGSAVCCVDEVSSGLDPLSRRKIWDILLAERGRRTIILTTHFLDEADLLADNIAILSKGTLRASGSSAALKDDLGAGYRIHLPKDQLERQKGHGDASRAPDVDGVEKKDAVDVISYIAPSSALAARVIRSLESNRIRGYSFSGPTIEDVFLQLAEEIHGESEPDTVTVTPDAKEEKQSTVLPVEAVIESPGGPLKLMDGKRIGYLKQMIVLFRKRCTVAKTNWFPYAAAFIIPIIAAGLVTSFIRGESAGSCAPPDDDFAATAEGFSFGLDDLNLGLVIGPTEKFNLGTAASVLAPVFLGAAGGGGNSNGSDSGSSSTPQNPVLGLLSRVLEENTTFVDRFDSFQEAVLDRRAEIMPAGIWLGGDDAPATLAYLGNRGGMINALLGQNMMNMLLSNVSVAARYAPLEIPWNDQNTASLQLLVYMGLVLCFYPGFFALYPSLERRRHVRSLEYSNGVRPFPLWAAYLAFDYSIVLVSTAIVLVLWAVLSDIWYHLGFMYLLLVLYGLASVLLAYVVSLFAPTQLSAFAMVSMYQAVLFLVYLIAYFFTFTGAAIETMDNSLLIVHFVISIFAPIGSVTRSFLLALNLFSTACDGEELAANPGGILQYGGPITYLVIQSAVLFAILLWADSGSPGSTIRGLFQRRPRKTDPDPNSSDTEVADELVRVTSSGSDDGLKVVHLTKSFGKNTAVDNVTFGIKRGEVFALLGPNGAGKSTIISLIRGDLKPSRHGGGDIFVENNSVLSKLANARASIGVCPQHDALDQMTVREHLEFYARIRGIPDIHVNVNAVLEAIGLQAFSTRMGHALSGGNKRKLSLGIALMGNPVVVLLDEPSSGLDAAAKRIMWKTLAATVPGRSILLTTHSMEEAAALASRAGILAKRMLALGTTENLRRRFGDALHVHLVSKSAPHTTPEETERVRSWVTNTFPGAQFDKTYHGQMRFAVPTAAVTGAVGGREQPAQTTGQVVAPHDDLSDSAIGQLVVILEEERENLGIMHFSVSPTTLDQVFLTIVGKNNVQEEGYRQQDAKKGWGQKFRGVFHRSNST